MDNYALLETAHFLLRAPELLLMPFLFLEEKKKDQLGQKPGDKMDGNKQDQVKRRRQQCCNAVAPGVQELSICTDGAKETLDFS